MPDGRLVVVSMAFEGYGGERVAASLVSELAGSYDVTAVQLGAGPWPPSLGGVAERVRLDRSAGLRAAGRLAGELAAVYDRVRPDGVVSVMTYANLVALLARRRSAASPPIVVSEHSIASRNMPYETHGSVMRNACRLLYPTATAVVGVSEAATEDVVRFLRPARLRTATILNPCVPVAGPSPAVLAPQQRRLVCVAALKGSKDHDLLLRAVALLPTDVSLDLVGDGPLRDELCVSARSLGLGGRVRFHGRVANPSLVVSGAAAAVLASRWEGFGLVALEAAEAGVPMVVVPRGALPEVVPRFAPGRVAAGATPEALAAAICSVLDDGVPDAEWARARAERDDHLRPARVAAAYAALLGLPAAPGQASRSALRL